jgi:hypothetical protein
MSTVDVPPSRTAAPPRDLRRFWRVVLAAALPLGPLAVAVSFATQPYANSDDTPAVLAAILADPLTNLRLALGLVAPGLLVIGSLTAGHLARRGAPVLATVATTINVVAYSMLAAASSSDFMLVAAGHAGIDPATISAVLAAMENDVVPSIALGLFVPGHVLGMILLAVALRRARVLPRWAAVVLGISQPIHFLAFVVLENQYVDALAGWGFTAVGFAATAVALLRTPDERWDLPPVRR